MVERRAAGWAVHDIAAASGVSERTVWKWLRRFFGGSHEVGDALRSELLAQLRAASLGVADQAGFGVEFGRDEDRSDGFEIEPSLRRLVIYRLFGYFE